MSVLVISFNGKHLKSQEIRCDNFLSRMLCNGPTPYDNVRDKAQEEDIPIPELLKAAERLAVQDVWKEGKHWWRLPAKEK